MDQWVHKKEYVPSMVLTVGRVWTISWDQIVEGSGSNKCWFPKVRSTILVVPIMRTIVFAGLYWGSLILGNYQIQSSVTL